MAFALAAHSEEGFRIYNEYNTICNSRDLVVLYCNGYSQMPTDENVKLAIPNSCLTMFVVALELMSESLRVGLLGKRLIVIRGLGLSVEGGF